jgi:hypothetical protein
MAELRDPLRNSTARYFGVLRRLPRKVASDAYAVTEVMAGWKLPDEAQR